MRRAIAVLIAMAVATAAHPHGASRGLHLHLTPDAAAPGATVSVELDAAEPMAKILCGVAGAEPKPKKVVPGKPTTTWVVKVRVPPDAAPGTILSVVAEVTAAEGRTFRASALLPVLIPSGEARTAPPSRGR